ncbi:MAG TPA: CoA transferase [Sphingomonadaceae bacterium]|nr:CoA transferase [Sphingomonadaceae bacterium]
MSRPKLLAGITAVEIGTSVAAPVAGHILADLGATLIKIERPGTGDDARGWGPPFDEDGTSPVFQALNRNKRSVTVDFRDDEAVARLRAFILAEADVVLQNLRPGVVAGFGLDAPTLRAENPRLVYCNITAFGQTGPLRLQPGYDPLMQASAGIMSVTGAPEGDPVRVGPSLVDQGAGMWSVIGILAALHARDRTGAGCVVDNSLYETALAWLPAQFAAMAVSGRVPGRIGTENAGMVPYRAFAASDGWIVIAAGNDNLFTRFANAVGRPAWLDDPRFATNQARVVNRIAVNQAVADLVAAYSVAELREKLSLAGVPNAPVLSLDQVVVDPQFEALGICQPVGDGGRPLIGLPLSFDGERPALETSSPALGEANALLSLPESGQTP